MIETGLFNRKKVKLKKKNTEKKLLFLVYIFNCSIKSVYCLMKNTWIKPNDDICFNILWFLFKSKSEQEVSESLMTLTSRGGTLQNETGEVNHDLFFHCFGWTLETHTVFLWHISLALSCVEMTRGISNIPGHSVMDLYVPFSFALPASFLHMKLMEHGDLLLALWCMQLLCTSCALLWITETTVSVLPVSLYFNRRTPFFKWLEWMF